MTDREKVIEGLEAMREFFGFGLPSQSPVFEAYRNILTDTLALLKEQEPQKVINQYANWDYELKGNCPKCNAILYEFDNVKACGVCGQAVKWNDSN